MVDSTARIAVGLLIVFGSASLTHAQEPDGAALYTRTCSQCHDTGANRAPNRDSFRSMPAERVMAAMETGSMITMANGRTAAERRAIAEFLTGKSLSNPVVTTPAPAAMCSTAPIGFDSGTGPRWTGWGQNTSNTRFQDAPSAGLKAADIPRLKLKWAFAFPGDLQSYSQASIVGGRIFVGSWGGTVYSLSAVTGCIHWFFNAGQGVRSAVTVARVDMPGGARDVAFFGDARATCTPSTPPRDDSCGKRMWTTSPSGASAGLRRITTGACTSASRRERKPPARFPLMNAAGSAAASSHSMRPPVKQIWKSYTIAEQPKPTKKNAVGTQLWGPSGAPVWATPSDGREVESPLRHHRQQLQRPDVAR